MSGDNSPVHSRPGPDDWDPAAGGTAPRPDRLFTALADRQRRRLLWYLLDESPASVGELADVLVGWRLADTTGVGSEAYERVLAALHHSHLPLLDDAGLVAYDREAETVTASSLAPAVEGVVQFAHQYDAALPER